MEERFRQGSNCEFRAARLSDVDALFGLINASYLTQDKDWRTGDRLADRSVLLSYMENDGGFLFVAETRKPTTTGEAAVPTIIGCVYVKVQSGSLSQVAVVRDPHTLIAASDAKAANSTLYLGLAAVADDCKRRGLGDELVRFALDYGVAQGCQWAEIYVVSIKPWLEAWYVKKGFYFVCESPWPEDIAWMLKRPCHFRLLQKRLKT